MCGHFWIRFSRLELFFNRRNVQRHTSTLTSEAWRGLLFRETPSKCGRKNGPFRGPYISKSKLAVSYVPRDQKGANIGGVVLTPRKMKTEPRHFSRNPLSKTPFSGSRLPRSGVKVALARVQCILSAGLQMFHLVPFPPQVYKESQNFFCRGSFTQCSLCFLLDHPPYYRKLTSRWRRRIEPKKTNHLGTQTFERPFQLGHLIRCFPLLVKWPGAVCRQLGLFVGLSLCACLFLSWSQRNSVCFQVLWSRKSQRFSCLIPSPCWGKQQE